jgi:hypothetical protein
MRYPPSVSGTTTGCGVTLPEMRASGSAPRISSMARSGRLWAIQCEPVITPVTQPAEEHARASSAVISICVFTSASTPPYRRAFQTRNNPAPWIAWTVSFGNCRSRSACTALARNVSNNPAAASTRSVAVRSLVLVPPMTVSSPRLQS